MTVVTRNPSGTPHRDEPEGPQKDRANEAATEHVPKAQAVINEAKKLRRRRRQRWTIVFGLALVLSIAGILVANKASPPSLRTKGHTTATPSPTVHSLPNEVVAWRNFNVEVISSKSGRVIRTLATDIALFRGIPHPSVSPDGIVYFDQGVKPPSGLPTEQIWSVPLRGGPVKVVANGRDPAISPNGQLLAYVTDSSPEAIVVLDLSTGTSKTWTYSSVDPDIAQLSWSPDSQSLALTAVIPSANRRTESLGNWLLDTAAPSGPLDTAQRILLPLCPPPGPWAPFGTSRTMAWTGYVSSHVGIGACQHYGLTSQGDSIHLEMVDISTGRVIAHLPALSGRLGVGNTFDGTESTISTDASGLHLLIGKAGTGSGALYRWSINRPPAKTLARPVLVTRGAFSASWVN
jgi:hypothetical protein